MFEHKVVKCIDCHMGKRDTAVPDEDLRHNHTFRVQENLPYSCGTYPGGCHESHKTDWAAKQIKKGKIHGKETSQKGSWNR